MPELPEVETTRQAIMPYVINRLIKTIVIRHQQLRLPVSTEITVCSSGQQITAVERRAKYLLLHLSKGYILIHLGMSGHLRLATNNDHIGKHDHIDLELSNGIILRYNDPRRFGLWLYIADNPLQHRLLAHLGPEPLSDNFTADYLQQKALQKTQAIKSFIMTNDIVVGVGNIYATESLFLAGIHPKQPAGSLTKQQYIALVDYIKQVLQQAILAGGTTLRDFHGLDGSPGYFVFNLQVYGRKNQACFHCGCIIELIRIGNRSSTFCPNCQPLR